VVYEKANKPLGQQQVQLEIEGREVLTQSGHQALHQPPKHFNINKHAQQVRILIKGKHHLHQLNQYPESFLLRHNCKQPSRNGVPPLAVADCGTAQHIRGQHIPQRPNQFLQSLGVLFLRKRALQVYLNLVEKLIGVLYLGL
jgi:hypothetical protein